MREIRRWTPEEISLLYTDRSSEDIAEELGRSVVGVKRMRYYHTGHYIPRDKAEPTEREQLSPLRSEVRILDLAKKIGVKLEGVR